MAADDLFVSTSLWYAALLSVLRTWASHIYGFDGFEIRLDQDRAQIGVADSAMSAGEDMEGHDNRRLV